MRTPPFAALALLLTCAACAVAPAPPATSADRFAPLRAEIERTMREQKILSLAIGVAAEGKIVWEEAFGVADRERNIAATPETIYATASVSKPFTATGLMLLAERGLIRLDRPAGEYLGEARLTGWAGDPSAATVRHVLQHRAGLPAHGRYFYRDEPHAAPPVEETIRRHGILVAPPGERYTYSNLGYGIAAYITHRVAGRPYDEFMRNEVFEPLGMRRTSVEIGREPGVVAAVGYDREGRPLPYYSFDEWGSGRVYSTVHDLLLFGMFHLKERLPGQKPILQDATIDAMVEDNHSTGTPLGRYGPEWFYGLGWGGRRRTEYNPFWYGHDGRMPGVSADLKLYPEHRVVVAVLSNNQNSLTYELAAKVVDILVPASREARLRDPLSHPPPPTTPAPAAPALTGTWSGTIRTWNATVPAALRVDDRGGVFLRIGEEPETLLRNARFENGRLRGAADGTLPLAGLPPVPHDLDVDLTLRGDRLMGAISVSANPPRSHFHLACWMDVGR